MSKTDLVRMSRDGDQFHYYWAARRCLYLLSPTTDLKAITIEGPSLSETSVEDSIVTGTEVIDVAEYYGSEILEEATFIRYIQLKHSTVRASVVWTPSELKKTLKGFAERFTELQQKFSFVDLDGKLEFCFVSNRPIGTAFLDTIHDVAGSNINRHPSEYEKLERFTHLSATDLECFCKLLRLEGNHEGLWEQENIFFQEIGNYYLNGADIDAPLQLKELVTRKALSASANKPAITKIDVLRALKTDENQLFPAPCLIQDLENPIPRQQETELFRKIVQANSNPIIIHASGGVGKSIFASRIKLGLPEGSSSVLYDCFGNGQYRSRSNYRHRHKDALVQITNELAAKGLCHPLIPSANADPTDYMKAFISRLNQSVISLRAKNEQAILCIIVDAADNAQMAAEEMCSGERAFIRDLIRETLPTGVHLVTLCRTHRQEYLDPPSSVLRLELRPFVRVETATHLHGTFPDATEQDIDEFHRLSSQNPRVQAMALAQRMPLSGILRSLGPNPSTIEDMIEKLLDGPIEKLRDEAGIEKEQIDSICAALATLRPLVPLSVLASMSKVDESMIKSFAIDLGRPLLVTDSTIQFLDEPAETWFRDKFKPTGDKLKIFVERLKPLIANSAYVASSLPPLMLEADQLTELIDLALSSQALPNTSPLERRDIELQRFQFALKASLRAKRYPDAVKLALKAAGESTGNERQSKLLQVNTDLVAKFMGSDYIQELVSRRTFDSGWIGSHHAYEAGLLSERKELLGDARSRLRMASEWLQNWSRLPDEERRKEEISDNDILEITIAHFNIHGADSCARELRGWQPREVSFRVGRLLANRFIDHGRYDDLNHLALAATNNSYLVLAIILELIEIHRIPPKCVVERMFRLILHPRTKFKVGGGWEEKKITLRTITALVEAAYRLSIGTPNELSSLLKRYLPTSPPRDICSHFNKERFHILRAYALWAVLSGQSLSLIDLAHDELRKKLEESPRYADSQDVWEFRESIGVLLPWHLLWARNLITPMSTVNLASVIIDTKTISTEVEKYRHRNETNISDEIAGVWFDILMTVQNSDSSLIDMFKQWIASLKRPLWVTRLTSLARSAAKSPSPVLKECALEYTCKAFSLIQNVREDAESKSYDYSALARAILTISPSEARVYFEQAVEDISKFGDELFQRWEALLDLADHAASQNKPNPSLAYRLARCAELVYEYVDRDKHFDWKGTIEAISALCGNSSLAILSRWRDRDFGRTERILPIAINFLVADGTLEAKIALALTCFRAEWNVPLLLKNVFMGCTDKADKQTAAEFIYHYMKLETQSSKVWRELKTVLSENSIELPELDIRIALSEQEEQAKKSGENSYEFSGAIDQERQERLDWDGIFDGVDLNAINDISLAYQRFKNSKLNNYYHGHFFEEACRRVPAGREAEFLIAIAEMPDFDLYNLHVFLKQIPERWKSKLSVKSTFKKIVAALSRKFCMMVTHSRYYEIFPLKTICELSGIPEGDLIDVVLTAIGETSEVAGTSRLFTLIGLLAMKLTKNEAIEGLSFALDLYEPLLKEADGDGSWSSKLEPPAEIESSVAGYIWACLAAPRASLRWEAAHVVRALCTFEHKKILGRLIELANGSSSEAFHDKGLYFYEMHACQWLLIGLCRAAKEHPEIIASHVDFLRNLVFCSKPHILIREFAKRALLTLIDAGFFDAQADLRQKLVQINVSQFSPVESKSYQYVENEETDIEDVEDRFHFGMDIGPYWFEPLGRCFAMPQARIVREASLVIKNDWQVTLGNYWEEDERHRRNIFKSMEAYHSHGSYPRVDELRFYLSYHAMMVVAEKLLATTPMNYDPNDCEDTFYSWLCRHNLSRQDGNWLADRRDPLPLERPTWKDEKETDNWCQSIVRSDFDQILMTPDERINLWGYWTWASGHRKESIKVCSALVSPDRSMALLRALYSAENPYDYRIPAANDDLQIDSENFQLKGWIVNRSIEEGIDTQDPWSGAIQYPPLEPAAYVVELMKLNSDSEHRRWFVQDEDIDVAWSQIWGHVYDKDDGALYESGTRFQASFAFIMSLLRDLKMDLIVEVDIDRRFHNRSWERSNNNDIGFLPPNIRLFLIKSDGSIGTL